MTSKTWIAAAAASLSALAAAHAEEVDKTFKAEHVFDVEYAVAPQISPDGSTVVYVRRKMDKLKDAPVGDLWTIDVRSGAHRPLVAGEGSNASVRWSPSGDRLLYLTGGERGPELRVLYMDTGRSFSLAHFEKAPSAPEWSPDGRHIVFSMFVPGETPSFAKPVAPPEGAIWNKPVRIFDDIQFRFDGAGYREKGENHIFVISSEGGTPRQVTHGDNGFSSPDWLDNDTLVVVGNDVENPDLDPIESEIYKVELSDLSRTPLTTRDGPDGAPVVSGNGERIAFLGYDDKVMAYQQTDLYVMNRDGGGIRNLTADYDRSIDSIAWRGDGRAVLALVEDEGELAVVSIDMSGRVTTLADDVGGTSIGRPYAAGSFSVASSGGGAPTIAYTQNRITTPSDIAVKRGSGSARRLTDLNADFLPYLDLAEIEEIKVPSSHDGREIEAWVALPPGFEADGSYPMILEIHGGPFAMYGPTFSPEIQRYAAEGYVTVYVNPRGSTGYGEEFAQLINLAYPGQDYDDLMSIVDHLVAQNYVSEDRLFVTGGSGGGVLTSWIVGNTDRFAAAATIKPVINWMTMALAGDIAAYVARHWMQAMPWENRDRYWDLSPISRVNNVTTPTLVMVGEADWRTPAWEAEQFYTALKLQDVDTALVRVPDSPHFIAGRPSRLIAKTDNIMGWFAKYDPAKTDDTD